MLVLPHRLPFLLLLRLLRLRPRHPRAANHLTVPRAIKAVQTELVFTPSPARVAPARTGLEPTPRVD